MTWTTIRKKPAADEPAPNLIDETVMRAGFSWENARAELAGLPNGGLNIAYEAVDRQVEAGLGKTVALRWLGKNGERREYTYADLAHLSNRFANLLERFGIGKGDRVCTLAGRIPELYVTALGTLKAGAVFCPLDGHVSPLRLLRALLQAFVDAGGALHTGTRIDRIEARGSGFVAHAAARAYAAERIVLAAGLGNRALAPMVGLRAPVVPNRGQVLISERVQPFLRYPTLHVRQTGDGGVQIGDSKEDVGFDDGTTIDQLARITARALRCFPLLAGVNIVRSWGALRVMSPDGLPIYEASTRCPGAFVASCHSGITLAAQHAGALVAWMRGGAAPAALAAFGSERFDVQAA